MVQGKQVHVLTNFLSGLLCARAVKRVHGDISSYGKKNVNLDVFGCCLSAGRTRPTGRLEGKVTRTYC